MSKGTRWWILGLTLVALVICGGLMGLGLLIANNMGEDTGGPAFGDAVAIIRVEGMILPGDAPPPSPFGTAPAAAYSQQIIDRLKRAEKNDNVKAIILFVDSPGGSALASDEVARHIKAMEKPIIVSMGSLAASGGYYISAPTGEIWAAPQTLTCSIGVIMQFINVEEFADEYGITGVTIKSGQFKDTGNPFREVTEADREILQSVVDEAYADFVQVIVEGRAETMTEAEVREIADGRICTGRQALEFGLVDEIGYLPDVIDRAAEIGGIEGDPRIIEYEDSPGFWGSLASVFYRPSPVQELQQLLHYHSGSPLMYLYIGP